MVYEKKNEKGPTMHCDEVIRELAVPDRRIGTRTPWPSIWRAVLRVPPGPT